MKNFIAQFKTEDEIREIGFEVDGNIWSSEYEYIRRYNQPVRGFYSVISRGEDLFGKIVTNIYSLEGSNNVVLSRFDLWVYEDFEVIHGWAVDHYMTKETNPEYFL